MFSWLEAVRVMLWWTSCGPEASLMLSISHSAPWSSWLHVGCGLQFSCLVWSQVYKCEALLLEALQSSFMLTSTMRGAIAATVPNRLLAKVFAMTSYAAIVYLLQTTEDTKWTLVSHCYSVAHRQLMG